ncbi:MAG: transglutaminase family protein [Chloroflexi bacterium]|nr:transglutaminase family protein [Chloroflexota bacterium]
MRIAVTHTTRLDYTGDVVEAVVDARLGPLSDADQRVERFELRLDPAGQARRYLDGFANAAHLITCHRPHSFLEIVARSQVQTYLSDPFMLPGRLPPPLTPVELADALDPSPLVPRFGPVDEMAAPFRPADPGDTFDAVKRLSEMIYHDFTYRQHVTDVGTTVEQILQGRQGVCQDFTHLLIGLCRSLGIPARYVSGYIVQRDQSQAQGGGMQSQSSVPTDGAPSRGGGASHAWVEAFTPTHGWRGFDPTNNLVANERYVKVAIGRDYSDVPPTRGTYGGGATESLTVSVTTRVLD